MKSLLPRRLRSWSRYWPLWLAAALAGCAAPLPPASPPAPTTSKQQVFPYESGRLLLETRGSTCRLTLQGALDHAAVRRIGPALQAASAAGCSQRTAVLQSTGGVIGDAITLGAMLRNRGYHTELPPGQTCDSPCILVYAAGLVRTAPAVAGTGFRFTQIPPDLDFGRQTCATELSRGQQLTLARYLRAMLPEHTANAVYQQWLQADCRQSGQATPAQALAMGLVTTLR